MPHASGQKQRLDRFRQGTVLSTGDENCTAGVFFASLVCDYPGQRVGAGTNDTSGCVSNA